MKKIILLFLFILPLLSGAQNIRVQQLRSTGEPIGKVPITDGAGHFNIGTIDTSMVDGLATFITNNMPVIHPDSMKIVGTILKIYPAGSTIPDSVDLATLVNNPLDSVRIVDSYLKIYSGGNAVPDSALIDIPGDNWGTDVAHTDETLTGDGTSGDPLKVDTTKVATPADVAEAVAGITDSDNQTLSIDSTVNRVFTISVSGGNSVSWKDSVGTAGTGDNWGSQVVEIGTGLSGNGTSGSPLVSTVTGNATHTGEVTGSTALTIADNVVDYANLDETLKQNTTNSTLTWDVSGSGIITCSRSSSGTVAFSNPQVNKYFCVVLTLISGATITWPSSAKILAGSATLGDGTFYIYIHCISSSIYTVSITSE